jgi:hypothetical protein
MVESEARPVTEDNGQVGRGTARDGKPREIRGRLGARRACGLCVESPGGVTIAQARQTVRDVPQPFPRASRGYPLVRGWTVQILEEESIIRTT